MCIPHGWWEGWNKADVKQWVHDRQRCSHKINAQLLNQRKVEHTKRRIKQLKAVEQANKDWTVDSPMKFTSFTKWDDFKDSFELYLKKITRAATCPLLYVL